MSQDQRRRADEWLERIAASLRSPHLNGYALKHIHTLLSLVVSALFPVAADDLAEDPMHPTGRCTCGGGGDCEWCDAHAALDDEPCNCPQALTAEQDRARADANSRQLAVDLAGAERELAVTVEQANASVHREWERANAAEERADHLDRGHEVLAEELAAAHTLTAHLERRIKALADRLAEAEADGSAAVDKLTSETARADRAELRVTQLAEHIAEDVADETTAAVRLANVCVYLGCCDQAFAETATKTMVERAAQVDAAEAALTTARAEWTSTRADLEADIERLHERVRLLQRLCPGPSPAAQVMQPVTPFHRDEAVRIVVERLRRIPTGCANHYTDWANQIAFGSPDPGDQNYEPLIYLAQESVMAGRESMAGLKRGGNAKAPGERLAAVLADADEHGPTVPPVAVLDDPRMDGVYWNAAAEVTAEMVRAWPFWEWWTADETAVLSAQYVAHGSMAVPTHKLRPLRLPGMDASGDGVIGQRDMSNEALERGSWQCRYLGGDWHTFTASLRGAIRDEFRPAIWAELDTAGPYMQGTPYFDARERVRAEVLARTPDVNEPAE